MWVLMIRRWIGGFGDAELNVLGEIMVILGSWKVQREPKGYEKNFSGLERI